MARPKLNLITGGAVPAGPMRGGLPAFGGQVPRADRRAAGQAVPRSDHRSKKAYTGTVAGLGRSRPGVTIGSGPRGPGAHAFHATGVQLPARSGVRHDAVQFHPSATVARRPSLMTRIGSRIRARAAALGL